MCAASTNGKICYIDMPATDIARSADFYSRVFGWKVRQRGDGATAFDDGVGQVSGTWSAGRPPSSQLGLLVYVMVDDAEASRKELAERGVEVSDVQVFPWGSFVFFKDPDGNGWALQAMTHRAQQA